MTKKVYIISHSHLDREWYMPYEQHHMRVVELFDDLIDCFEQDPEFKYFHLDGQTIPLDDYFEVKPQNKAKITRFIQEGRLRIGPFYILQDDFLISSEANVRNTLIGLEESKKYGTPVKLGYFPDTFGNMGQTPQLMKESGFDAAAFGRGVKPTGLNNAVSDSYASQFSEMTWQGPDGSEILGILFANWYSNGNEIPTQAEEAKVFWDQKLADAERYASSDHLLMMNGCDHQPVQKDVGQAIALANDLYPDYEFIHANFDMYLAALKADLPADLDTVKGELTSQETNGWYTLANTASSRIYLKQANSQTQSLLENQAEPLASLASTVGKSYPSEVLTYAWKYLLQNHPHDSICGCSVDEVHREMMTRYGKASETAKFVRDESLEAISKTVDTQSFTDSSWPFVLANTSNHKKTEQVQVELIVDKIFFKDAYPKQAYQQLADKALPEFEVVDSQGQVLPSRVLDSQVAFRYDLPKDAFRVPYMAKIVTVSVYVKDFDAMSLKTLALRPVTAEKMPDRSSMISQSGQIIENDQVKLVINDQGALDVTDKVTGHTYADQLVFENVGDIGNEYIFRQSRDEVALLSTAYPYDIEVLEDRSVCARVKLTHHMQVPQAADAKLQEEQAMVVDITQRTAQRSSHLIDLDVVTEITVYKDSKQVRFETSFDNQAKDHRLRVLFKTGLVADSHRAESIFEAVARPNQVGKYWENPSNPQHQHAFVNIQDATQGVTIGNVGINEYEVLPEDNTVSLTLLRAVGEMGDWGYFATPEAQCLGRHTLQYSFEAHTKSDYYDSLQAAIGLKTPINAVQSRPQQVGQLPSELTFVSHQTPEFVLTAFKASQDGQGLIVRGYNLDDKAAKQVHMTVLDKSGHACNLLEEAKTASLDQLPAAGIWTSKWQ